MKTRAPLPDLGALEHAVMQLVWRHAPVTAEAVREKLPRPLKESTVRTVLRRLEEKGYVTHTVEGRTFCFQPAERRNIVAARAVQQIVENIAGGSLEEVLIGLIETEALDAKKLQAVSEKIARARKK